MGWKITPPIPWIGGREVLGLACEVTGITSPEQAIEELVTDALDRWAKLQALDRLASALSFAEDDHTPEESALAFEKSAPRGKSAKPSR